MTARGSVRRPGRPAGTQPAGRSFLTARQTDAKGSDEPLFSPKNQCSVLVVSPSRRITELFVEMLPRGEFSRYVTVGSCGEAKRMLLADEFDIVVVNAPLPDEFGIDFASDLVADSSAAVLLIVPGDQYPEIACRVESFGVMTVSKPLNKSTLYTAMKLVYATSVRLKVMDKKNRSLAAKMNEMRVVNRAKWMLIESLGMTEEQAHHYIEKQAMDQRLPKGDVAVSILNTYGK